MKKILVLAAMALFCVSVTPALAGYPGEVDTRPLMANPAPLADQLTAHQLYVKNLRDAGFNPNDTSNWGQVNTDAVMRVRLDHKAPKRAPDGPDGHMLEAH